ncbi:extracellular solute-binding protein [Paenibacillaceae bacterium WGS1546]|uniref:extracellular solute-binding protein n=1 Tax=Cohnella sp. WGS1546 TaxID=3366810 RepID=UPI00372CEAE4
MKLGFKTTGWLMAVGMLAVSACSGGQSKPSGQAGEDESRPVKIEIALQNGTLPRPEEDALKQEIDRIVGIDLVLNPTPANEYQNNLNVRLAAGNYPDVFQALSPIQLKEYADKGLLLDLTPYLQDLKPVMDFQGDSFTKGQIDGKQYAIIRHADVPFTSYWIRKDWLDELGLKAPTTLEELFNVAKAFTEEDPDRSGGKNTLGITGFELSSFYPILGAYGVGNPTHLYMKDGKLMTGVLDPNMPEALAYLKSMMDAGVIDQEIITNKNLLDVEKAFQGQAGILFQGWTNISRKTSYEQYKSINPNAEWIQLDAPAGPGGKYAESYDYAKAAAYWAVSKSVENDPEKLKKVIELFNFLSTEEGIRLVSYGVEGKHYTMENGSVTVQPLLEEEGAYFWMYQLAGRHEQEYLQTRFHYVKDDIEFAVDQPRINALDGYIYHFPANYNRSDAERYMMEELIKFIYGKRPLTEYGQFLETLNTTFNYQSYLDSAEEQLKERGVLK